MNIKLTDEQLASIIEQSINKKEITLLIEKQAKPSDIEKTKVKWTRYLIGRLIFAINPKNL